MELGGLELEDGVALAQALDDGLDHQVAVELWRRAAGSPFWLTALARSRGSADPLALLADRARRLTVDAAQLLNVLVVGARPFTRDELASILGWPAERTDHAAEEVIAEALAVEDLGRIRLSHDLIRETAARAIPPAVARKLHARIAEVLERASADDADLLGEALDHRIVAGLPVADLAMQLVASPGRRLFGDEQLRRLSTIADNLASGSLQQQELDIGVGKLAMELGHQATAVRHWDRVAASAGTAGVRQRAHLEAASSGYDVSPVDEVRKHLAEARSLPIEPVMAIRADTIEARVALEVDSDVHAAFVVADRAARTSRELLATAGRVHELDAETRTAMIAAFAAAATAAMYLERDEYASDLEGPVAEMADGLGEEARLAALLHLGFSSETLGHLSQARDRFREALDRAERLMLPKSMAEASHHLAQVLYRTGELAEAREMALRTDAVQARVRPWLWGELGKSMLHAIDLSMGAPGAEANLAAVADGLDLHYRIWFHQTIATWLARRDAARRQRAVLDQLAAASAASETVQCPRCQRELQIVSAELLARIGHVDAAKSELDRWERGDSGSATRLAWLWRAQAQVAIGVALRDPTATRALGELGAQYEAEGLLLDAAWARLDLGRALAGSRDRADAISAYRSALRLAEATGATVVERLAAQGLRALGVRAWRRTPRSSTGEGVAGLSDRERQVAGLIADGATNLEVAASLAISPKTVERHVTNILAKLGARNRTELAGLIHGASVRGSPDD